MLPALSPPITTVRPSVTATMHVIVFSSLGRDASRRLAEKAALIHLRHGGRVALGTAVVDQGIWLYYLDRPRESIEALNAALEMLPEGPSRNRCTAFQVKGLAFQNLGDLDAALRNVISAQEAAVGIAVWAKGKLLWLRARIHVDRNELDQAAAYLAAVLETFRELHHGEMALASCELIRVQLLLRRPDEAHLTATSMRALLEPLRHNKIISAAIADLLRCGQEGLTLALVRRVKARIESERQHREKWQSLRVDRPEN